MQSLKQKLTHNKQLVWNRFALCTAYRYGVNKIQIKLLIQVDH